MRDSMKIWSGPSAAAGGLGQRVSLSAHASDEIAEWQRDGSGCDAGGARRPCVLQVPAGFGEACGVLRVADGIGKAWRLVICEGFEQCADHRFLRGSG